MIALYIAAALVFLFCVYLFLIMPRMAKRPDMSAMIGRIYAHRGMFTNPEIPENSMEAFRLAVEHGYGIELDLHLTTDGKVVVFHDDSLTRVCGIEKNTDSCSFGELSECRLFDTEYKIPLFTDVLALVDKKVPLIVELKGKSAADTKLADAAWDILKSYDGPYCVESFNPMLIKRFRQIAPHVATGILSSNLMKTNQKDVLNFVLTTMATNMLCRPDFVAYEHAYDKNIAFILCKNLFHPHTAVWTLRENKDFDRYKKSYEMLICENLPDISKG